MNKWRVFFLGEDITAKVDRVEIRWQADAICGECEVSLADRTGLGLLGSRPSRDLALRVEELVSGTWVVRGEFLLDQVSYPDPLLDVSTATLWGRSKSALLGLPWAAKISKQWPAATSIAAIIQELVSPCGVNVVVDEDYPVCSRCYTANAQTPADVVRDLAEKSGQRLWPLPDGSVRVSPDNLDPQEMDMLDPALTLVSNVDSRLPDFGNRILISGDMAPDSRTVEVNTLEAGTDSVPADGRSTVKLMAVVRREDGEVEGGVPIRWLCSDGTLMDEETSSCDTSQQVTESLRADNYRQVTLRWPAREVTGVYASREHVPVVSDPSGDWSANNLMRSLGYEISGNQIVFGADLQFYDQNLWVRYSPSGSVNTWTAGHQKGRVRITAAVAGGQGSCVILQGVPGMGQGLRLSGPDDACFGSGPVQVTIFGRFFGAPATGQISLSLAGCGTLSATTATFGQGTVTETVEVLPPHWSPCVILSAEPVAGSASAVNAGGDPIALSTGYGSSEASTLYVSPGVPGERITVTYETLGVAHVQWTPPPQTHVLPPAPTPGVPITTTTIEDVFETLAAWHGPCPTYSFNGSLIQRAAFVTLSHDPFVGWPASNYQISCMYEHPRAGAITALVKSDVYHSHNVRSVRLKTLSSIMTGQFHEALVLAGAQVQVAYKREVTTVTQPGQSLPVYVRQPGCSGVITATFQDGSQAGVSASHSISARDCTP